MNATPATKRNTINSVIFFNLHSGYSAIIVQCWSYSMIRGSIHRNR